ncbi:MAG: YfcE family phosphodiesterase, partial [Lachnospiraceae bacterium]|nr:YfcE family phosphodiesterase [Lachnospiraceae bacterium]
MRIVKHILVISDTHGQFRYLDELREKTARPDYIIHLGDVARDQDYVSALFGCPVDMVAGNNDFFTELPGEFTIREGKHVILLTHGHGYSVSGGTDRIVRRAAALGADTVMFGHTHCPLIDI